MDNFRNILFVTRPNDDPTEGLKQALMLAKRSHAALKVLIAASELPEKLSSYNEAYIKNLEEKTEDCIETALKNAGLEHGEIELSQEVLPIKKFAVDIIQYVLRHGHDLLVKHVEGDTNKEGFRAADMAVLRKCPCPVWLWRPQHHDLSSLRVAAAVDVQNPDQEAKDLARRILKVAGQLSQTGEETLQVVSCWEYEFEEYLRNNSWIKLPEEEIDEAVAQAEHNHETALEAALKDADVSAENHSFRGSPTELLPRFITDNDIDILVMGTVGRTGIPGFIIGNTAEEVLQEVPCSLLALKPAGFKSPVDAY